MNLRTQIASLRQEAEQAVADVLLQLLTRKCKETVADYCTILRPLNSITNVTEMVFDKLPQTTEDEELWRAAYDLMIVEDTRSLRIKPTWSVGESLLRKLHSLKHLQTLDVSGKYRVN